MAVRCRSRVAVASTAIGVLVTGVDPAGAIARADDGDLGPFLSALRPEQDVVLLPDAKAMPGGRAPTLFGATVAIGSPPERIGAVLLDPAALRAALPSLVRADVVATRAPSAPRTGIADRLLAWELEIPFFNLTGKAWLIHRGDAIDLELVEGALAPGSIRFRSRWDAGARRLVLTCESRVDFRSGNWILRRLVAHDPRAAIAMGAAANLIMLRAVVLRAESPPDVPPRRPTAPIAVPPLAEIRATDLAPGLLAALRRGQTLALVRRAPTGRLAFVSVCTPVKASPADARARLSSPESWVAFPGWRSVRRHPPPDAALFDVVDDLALIDLDATWRWYPGPSARAIAGSTAGAALHWDFLPISDAAGGAAIALSLHPRLDASGFIERKMVASEPLMESALALAMAYADVAAAAAVFPP